MLIKWINLFNNLIFFNKKTPLFYALLKQNKDIINLLLKNAAQVTNIYDAVLLNDIKLVEPYLKQFINVNDELGQKPLNYSIEYDCNEVSEFLINNGADFNIKIKDNTILQVLLEKQNKKLVQLLIKKGVKINQNFIHNKSIYHYYAQLGFEEEVIKFLQENKNVNIKDDFV